MKFLFFTLVFSALQGKTQQIYSQNCKTILDDDYVQFTIENESLDFKKNAFFTIKVTAFEDDECQTPYLKFHQYFKVISRNEIQLDLKTIKVTYTALTQEVANALNLIKYCGIKNWKPAIETNVTGNICDEYRQLALGDLYFQIIQIQDGFLKFGPLHDKKYNGRQPSSRPVAFDSLEYKLSL